MTTQDQEQAAETQPAQAPETPAEMVEALAAPVTSRQASSAELKASDQKAEGKKVTQPLSKEAKAQVKVMDPKTGLPIDGSDLEPTDNPNEWRSNRAAISQRELRAAKAWEKAKDPNVPKPRTPALDAIRAEGGEEVHETLLRNNPWVSDKPGRRRRQPRRDAASKRAPAAGKTPARAPAGRAPAVSDDELRKAIRQVLKQNPGLKKWTVVCAEIDKAGLTVSRGRTCAMVRAEFDFPAGRKREDIAREVEARRVAAEKATAAAVAKAEKAAAQAEKTAAKKAAASKKETAA